MLAVIETGGKQYNIKVGSTFKTEKVDVAEGKTFDIENVLLISEEDGKNFKVGTPLLKTEKVTAKVLSHGKGDKIRVFKMKAKKRYSRVQGHRQLFSELEIVGIGGVKAKTPVKKEMPVKKAAIAKKAAPKKKITKNVTKAKKPATVKNTKSETTKVTKKTTVKKTVK